MIVTAPSAVLASGAIAFDPPLDGHMAAAAGLPLGLANKLFLALDDAEAFAPNTRLIGAPDRVDTGTYTLRPRGRALVDGYFGGDHARDLEKGGLAAFADAARQEITAALGHDIGARLKPIVATAWAGDPFAMGSYSHALPGHAAARAGLGGAGGRRARAVRRRGHLANVLLDGAWGVRGGDEGGGAGAPALTVVPFPTPSYRNGTNSVAIAAASSLRVVVLAIRIGRDLDKPQVGVQLGREPNFLVRRLFRGGLLETEVLGLEQAIAQGDDASGSIS